MDRRKSRRIQSKTIQWTEGKVVELKARQYNGQKEKGQTIYRILTRKLQIEQHEPHSN
jgi:hypothetical protein